MFSVGYEGHGGNELWVEFWVDSQALDLSQFDYTLVKHPEWGSRDLEAAVDRWELRTRLELLRDALVRQGIDPDYLEPVD